MVPLSIEGSSATILAFTDNIGLSVGLIVALAILILCSSFFSSCETAYSTANLIRLKNYQDEKRKGAKKAVYCAEKFDKTLITILIGNNLVNVASTTIAAFVFSMLIANPTISNVVNTIVMTLIVLTFGEILPKSFAKENPEELALKFSSIMYFFIKFFAPIAFLFLKMRKGIMKTDEEEDGDVLMTEDELDEVVNVMEEQGVLDESNAQIISSAISLGETCVDDIMTPRVDMICVEVNSSIEEIKNIFLEYQFSRIPVYEKDRDHIIGLLRERDLFSALIRGDKNINIRKLMTKPFFVPKETKVDDLIDELQKAKQHFAVVVDEYGGTDGIVTLEDALEELVGEIYDEYDDEVVEPLISKIDDSTYILNSELELDELFEQLELGKTPESEYNNIGGFIYSLCEEIPTEGMIVKYESIFEKDEVENPIYIHYLLNFEIMKVEDRRIRTLKLTLSTISDDSNDQ